MKLWSEYILARSVDQAVAALSSADGPARPVAGGTDLILELQQGRHSPVHTLVDLTQIAEMRLLEIRPQGVFIGASVPVAQIVDHPLVRLHAQAVSEACRLIGGPQVRNSATLGGNVAHALPAADGMIALVAMDAQVEIASPDGRRLAPMLSLFKGPGESTLVINREIVTGFYLPLRQPGQASGFSRVMRPQGVALPILNLAVWLERDLERIADIRIAVGPAGPTPKRASEVETWLRGKTYSAGLVAQASDCMRNSMKFRTSARRATAEYRYHLSGVLLDDVIGMVWERAAQVEVVT